MTWKEIDVAVREGFEPSIRFRIHTFQACSFSLSDTSPCSVVWDKSGLGLLQVRTRTCSLPPWRAPSPLTLRVSLPDTSPWSVFRRFTPQNEGRNFTQLVRQKQRQAGNG